MLAHRPAAGRGRSRIEWLDSRHTFSFADYYDPAHMGFRALRVINDDRVLAGAGFPMHPHQDMEILSYVLDGALEHKDSIGTGSVIRPGDVQRMSAGTGVRHSEWNHSKTEPVRFLQIWIVPEARGLPPGYEQHAYGDELRDRLRLVASRGGREGSLTIHQDAALWAGRLGAGTRVTHPIARGRNVWVQVAKGMLTLNTRALSEGDGAALTDEAEAVLEATSDAEVLVFDLA